MFVLTPRYETRSKYLTIVLLIGLILVTSYGIAVLPARIPVHFGLNGQPDRWGSSINLAVLAGVCLFVQGLLWAVRYTPVELMNFPGPRTPANTARQLENINYLFATLRPLLALMFLSLEIEWIRVAQADRPGLSIGVTLVFLVLILATTVFFVLRGYRLASQA